MSEREYNDGHDYYAIFKNLFDLSVRDIEIDEFKKKMLEIGEAGPRVRRKKSTMKRDIERAVKKFVNERKKLTEGKA